MSWGRRILGTVRKGRSASEEPDPPPAAEIPPVAPPAEAGSSPDVLESLKARIVELAEGRIAADEIDAGVNPFDYGYVDSLSIVSLLAFVEERYGVFVPQVELTRLTTLDELTEYVHREATRGR